MRTYNETRVNLSYPKYDKDGKTPLVDEKTGEVVLTADENVKEKAANEAIASAKTTGITEPSLTKIQTFQFAEVDTIDELMTLCSQYNTDVDSATKAAVAIVNRGLVLAQQKSEREFMLDSDQAIVEGVYDLMQDASKPGEGRRKADPASKALKALSDLLGRPVTQDELNGLLANFAAAPATV